MFGKKVIVQLKTIANKDKLLDDFEKTVKNIEYNSKKSNNNEP